MADSTQITQTSQRGLEPVSGKLESQHDHLRAIIAQRLSADHAALFAEPVRTGASVVAWFTERAGAAIAFADLALSEQVALKRRLQRLSADIKRLSADLEKQGDSGRDLARMTQDALVIPSDASLWSVGGQPVLVDWGRRRAEDVRTASEQTSVVGVGRRVIPPNAPKAADPKLALEPLAASNLPPPPRRAWTQAHFARLALWALFAVLLALSGALLLRSCGMGGPGWPAFLKAYLPDHCVAPLASANPALIAAEQAMREAERELALRQAQCRISCPAPAPPAPAPQMTPRPIDAAQERIDTYRALRGKLEVSLTWNSTADLDLAIACPDGALIDYRNPRGCGGQLALDMNASASVLQDRPLEHIIWETAPATGGQFRAQVTFFTLRTAPPGPVRYTLTVRLEDRVLREQTGVLNAPGANDVIPFTLPLSR